VVAGTPFVRDVEPAHRRLGAQARGLHVSGAQSHTGRPPGDVTGWR
jgi:hypothetical protein